jgi:hypothetical protein
MARAAQHSVMNIRNGAILLKKSAGNISFHANHLNKAVRQQLLSKQCAIGA